MKLFHEDKFLFEEKWFQILMFIFLIYAVVSGLHWILAAGALPIQGPICGLINIPLPNGPVIPPYWCHTF